MKNSVDKCKFPPILLGSIQLKAFFINHLDRIYCAKSHLIERLPEIRDHAHFSDLKHAITETMCNVEKQIIRIEAIYNLLNAESSVESCDGLIGTLEDAFTAIHRQSENSELRDLTIMFYMTSIESMEMVSFQILHIAAIKLINTEIRQLLLESFEEAKSDQALFLFITSRYLNN